MARDYAADWARLWQQLAPPELRALATRHAQYGGELQFAQAALGRRWRFDWCVPAVKVAVEIDGGTHIAKWSSAKRRCVVVGRHNSEADIEKLNAASLLGWSVLHFTPGMLKRDPVGCVELVAKTIQARGG